MRHRHGFTLVELMVALLIGGMLTLTAHGFSSAADSARRLEKARTALDREMNAHRWLGAALLSLEVNDTATAFDGQGDRATFSAWLATPDGWMERNRLTLLRDGSDLVAVTAAGRVVLSDSVVDAEFGYRLQIGSEAPWLAGWQSPVSAPVAVRLRTIRRLQGLTAVDTTVYLIKERG